MSTVPSVIVARHAGMRVLGISTITNIAAPDPLPGTVQSHEEVLETGKVAIPRLTALIHGVLANLPTAD
jgi:purine-nucleoside phosphorylase